ncbi:hypothetical protein RF11_05887 [Thelohanellus kitauei]|uniref:Uncharacterized protein n=1 Tax=Thelohanellus kitauei TaxID=669202 RepID=A0A0C2M8L4_THEKT|nr:hypothetical protein RF11_05887 [Thelohanellus kitauei]
MSNFYVETNRIETPETSTHRSYPEPENYLKIEVTDPITHLSSGNKFTDYQVTTKIKLSGFPSKKILKQLPFGSKDGTKIQIRIFHEQVTNTNVSIAQNPNIKVLKIFHMFLQSIIMDKECDDSTVLT